MEMQATEKMVAPLIQAPAPQGGELWGWLRANSINCSNNLVWEQEHPYTTPAKVVREQVRALAGAESEFKMNPAVQHGTDTEPAALECLARNQGYEIYETGSVQHKEYTFLRGSPDGLVGLDGGVEAKCPYYAKEPYSVFDPKKKMYLWQCYGVMEVCDLEWIDFICYLNDDNFTIERVERKEGFLEEKVSGQFLPQPRKGKVRRIDLWQAWHNQIQNEWQDPVLLQHHLAPLKGGIAFVNNDEELNRLDMLQNRIRAVQNRNKDDLQALADLKTECETLKKSIANRHGDSVTNGSTVVEIVKKTPPIDYKEAFEFLGGVEAVLEKDSNMENFRKTTNTQQVSIKQHKEDKHGG